ncbi:MAG: hypothetical protein M0R51_12850 [Clostridia bacterium]|jgi:hypothetical protein|nr:hypothetical protein [Clostridia bacterium]
MIVYNYDTTTLAILILGLLVGFLFAKYVSSKNESPSQKVQDEIPTVTEPVSEPYKYLTRDQKLAIADYADDVVDTLCEISEHEHDKDTNYTLTRTAGSIVTIIDGEVSIKELPPSD